MLNGHHSNKQQPIDETSNNNYIISYRQFIKPYYSKVLLFLRLLFL